MPGWDWTKPKEAFIVDASHLEAPAATPNPQLLIRKANRGILRRRALGQSGPLVDLRDQGEVCITGHWIEIEPDREITGKLELRGRLSGRIMHKNNRLLAGLKRNQILPYEPIVLVLDYSMNYPGPKEPSHY
ncbi:MAG TPA: hypothetical protein DD435_06540 [Cyanobacteria bacterium UBA8530]|nr:hypothetical protein [Cyanobacteria bacterium UBA8530]